MFINDFNQLLKEYKYHNILDKFDKDELIHEVIISYITRIESFFHISGFTFNFPFNPTECSWEETLLYMVTQLTLTKVCRIYDVNIHHDVLFIKNIFYSHLGYNRFSCNNCGKTSYFKTKNSHRGMSHSLLLKSYQCPYCKRSTNRQTIEDKKIFNIDRKYTSAHYFLEIAFRPVVCFFK